MHGKKPLKNLNFWEQRGPGWGPYPEMLVVELKNNPKLSAYQISTGSHGEESINRMIKDWVIHGSDDLKSWELVDRRLGETNWSLTEQRTFQFENDPSFRYYRLEVLQSNTPGLMRLYGWNFLTDD